MGAKWEKVLSNAIGVRGIHINSALVSAQNRKRIYWINWGMKPSGLFGDMESIIEQPKDRGILLKDILESQVDEKYFLSEKFDNWLNKHSLKTGNEYKKTEGNRKAGCLSVSALKSVNLSADFILDSNEQIIVHNTQRRDPNRPSIQKNKNAGGSGHLSRNDGKTYCLDSCNTNAVEVVSTIKHKYNGDVVENTSGKVGTITQHMSRSGMTNGFKVVVPNTNAVEIKYQKEIEKSLLNEKATTIDASYYKGFGVRNGACRQVTKGSTMINTSRIRRLTPIECERLQTVADNYTASVSDSQRYKMLGNGWTIELISYLFKHI
jgi:DNA (cytosine-5)-methyltransferase 3A